METSCYCLKIMIKIKKTLLESFTNKVCSKKIVSLGVDTASRTGWAIAELKDDYVEVDYGFINAKNVTSDVKYTMLINFFIDLVNKLKKDTKKNSKEPFVVIEDVFFGKSINVVKILSRIGMIVYVACELAGINKTFIYPSSSRSYLNLKCKAKKEAVHKEIVEKLKIDLDDEDIVDAIILSLNGLLEEKQGILA